MPHLNDLIEKRKFVKKSFRPWDLSGTGTVDQSNAVHDDNKSYIERERATEVISNTVLSNSDPLTASRPENFIEENQISISIHESDNKQVTNQQQLGNNKATIRKQRENIKITKRLQPDNISDNITSNMDAIDYLIDAIKKLSGIQKSIFYYVINLCSARGTLDTGNILCTDLIRVANCSVGSAKTSLVRLIDKHLIIRLKGKASRGGHMIFGITNEIQAASIQAQQALFNPFKNHQTGNSMGNISNNIASYSTVLWTNQAT
jgi:hypothetical protein